MKLSCTVCLVAMTIVMATRVASAQSQDDCKYLAVLTYLRTNKDVNSKIKSVFPKLTKRRTAFVDFNLSSRVDFLGIGVFANKLDSSVHGVSPDSAQNEKQYYEKYFFESYTSDYLEKLIFGSDAKLFLTFSRPVDDYLVAEIGNFDPKVNRKVKMGLGLKMFFKFGSDGSIQHTLYGVSAYN
jgi:hypothetical protein